MGIDFGMARIGIALSDDTKFLASPFETYKRKNEQDDLQHIINIIQEKKVDEIVCGLPYNMQGEEQEIAHKAREFGQNLANLSGCKLVLLDERMTSVVAEDILRQKYRDWRERKQHLDEVAAMVILQDYLDTL